MIWKLQTTFSNLSSMKVFDFQLQFHWSLFPRVQLIISTGSGNGLTPNRQETITQINADQIHRRIYTALGGNKITKSGRSFHWGLVHLVQSASLCWNSPKIFHTVFETLLVGAKSLQILPPDYWHPPQSNFTEYKQDVVAVFLCTCQWSMSSLASPVLLVPQWVYPCLPSPMHEWAARAAKPVTDPASLLKIDCHPSDCTLRNIMFHSREWSTCLLNWGKIYGYSYIWHNTEHCQIDWSILLFIFISEFIFD